MFLKTFTHLALGARTFISKRFYVCSSKFFKILYNVFAPPFGKYPNNHMEFAGQLTQTINDKYFNDKETVFVNKEIVFIDKEITNKESLMTKKLYLLLFISKPLVPRRW